MKADSILVREYTERFKEDLKRIGMSDYLSTSKLVLRPSCKSFYGRYFTSKKLIAVYFTPTIEEDTYSEMFKTMIHEGVHHIQHQDPKFIRRKGIMHSVSFWKLYHQFIENAIKEGIIKDAKRRGR